MIMDRDLLGASLIVSGMMLDSSPFYAMVSAPEPTVERDTVTSLPCHGGNPETTTHCTEYVQPGGVLYVLNRSKLWTRLITVLHCTKKKIRFISFNSMAC